MPEPIRTSSHIRTSSRRRGKRLTAEERTVAQGTFLKTFAANGNIRAACLAARIDRSLIYQWLEKDTEFTVLYHQAERDADDVIRAAIFKRAIHGYEKPVVSMGKIVYDKDGKPLMETMYSDALLALLAKARMHEFREKSQVDVNANVQTQVQSAQAVTIDTRSLSSEQLAQLKAFASGLKEKE